METIVLLAVVTLIVLIAIGYAIACAVFLRRHPPHSRTRSHSNGSSISGLWRYVFFETTPRPAGAPADRGDGESTDRRQAVPPADA